MNSNNSNASGEMFRPGTILQRLGGRQRSSSKTEYLAAKKLRGFGVPLIKIGNRWLVPGAAFEAWLSSPACLNAAAEAQQSKSRRATWIAALLRQRRGRRGSIAKPRKLRPALTSGCRS